MDKSIAGVAATPLVARPEQGAADAAAPMLGVADLEAPHSQDMPQIVAQPLRLSDLPDADLVASMPPERQWRRVHAAAVARNRNAYIDPATGYQVWTRLYLSNKGPCCGNACRHCPYGHENVPKPSAKSASAQ